MKSKIMKRQNVRTLSLIVCTFTYLLVGRRSLMHWSQGSSFSQFSQNSEENSLEPDQTPQTVTKIKKEIIHVERRDQLLEEEMLYRNKYNMTTEDFETLRRNVERTVPYYAGVQWKFSGSFYFALTVVTVIGYGHSTPQTVGGKIFCMFYAVAGIPLCIIMFQSVGERLNVFITYTLKKIRKCLKLPNRTVPETHVILVTMNLSMLVLSSGALMFDHYEHWGFLDSLYYCFITLTTIGFGDYVALQKDDALQDQLHYVVFSLFFILFGLTVISAAMNLLVLRFLTMNTEDERRDELEAAAAAQNAIHLDGDVITSNGNVHVVSNAQERAAVEYSEVISVCSCSCYKWRSNRGKETTTQNNRRRSQSIFTTSGKNNYGRDDSSDEGDSFLQYHSKRNSL